MAPPFRLSEDKRAELVRKWFAKEATQEQLAHEYGVSVKTVWEYIDRARKESASV